MKNQKNNIAFTLIEILVVVVIVGIIAGVIIVGMKGTEEKTNITKSMAFSISLNEKLITNLISEWKFDDYLTNPSSTTARDTWLGGNNGTISGATWKPSSDCISGSCLSFDGVNDYVYITNNQNLNPVNKITIEMWLKLTSNLNCDSNNNWRSVLYKGSICGTSTGYDVILEEGGSLTWDVGSSDSIRYSSGGNVLPVGNWVHLLFIYDSAASSLENTKIYFNGEKINGTYWNSGSGLIQSNSNPFYINNPSISCPNGSGNFPGLIDEVRIYNAAMPEAMIQQHYVQGLNSMLANKSISYQEYSQRMSEISSNLAIK